MSTVSKRAQDPYQDGKCANCGAVDPDYEKPVTVVPNTGDHFAMDLWIILLTASAAGLAVMYGLKKKRV